MLLVYVLGLTCLVMAMADCHGRNSNSWFAKKKGVKIRMLTTLKLHALLRRHLDSTDSLAFSPRNSHSLNESGSCEPRLAVVAVQIGFAMACYVLMPPPKLEIRPL